MNKPEKTAETEVKEACQILMGSLTSVALSVFFSHKLGYMQLTTQVVFTLIGVFILYSWLTFKILHGRNWARITYVFTSIAGLPLNLPIIASDFSDNVIIGSFTTLSVFGPFVAFYILFTSPGKNFFSRPASVTARSSQIGVSTPFSRLSELKELHSRGLITDEEFANKKASILAEF